MYLYYYINSKYLLPKIISTFLSLLIAYLVVRIANKRRKKDSTLLYYTILYDIYHLYNKLNHCLQIWIMLLNLIIFFIVHYINLFFFNLFQTRYTMKYCHNKGLLCLKLTDNRRVSNLQTYLTRYKNISLNSLRAQYCY